jgi:hypothetical protein
MAMKYSYDIDAIYESPEYTYKEAYVRAMNARELAELEEKVPMTAPEKRALRKWVASGHSWRESPGSRYVCDIGMDFLDVYRTDHEIAAATRGMTRAEKEAYIKEYTGYTDPTAEERERYEAVKATPAYVQKKYEKLYRQMLLLWRYLAEEGLWDEATGYLEEHKDDEIPVEFSFIL